MGDYRNHLADGYAIAVEAYCRGLDPDGPPVPADTTVRVDPADVALRLAELTASVAAMRLELLELRTIIIRSTAP
jgi:hypothetical protein